jgi:dihydrofolate reductase
MPKVRFFCAVSMDGFLAAADGSVAFLDAFEGDYGYNDFIGAVGAVVMGRKTYEVTRANGQWPYAGKRAYVLSRSRLNTEYGHAMLVPDGQTLLTRLELLDEADGDVWVVGGGEVHSLFLDAGAVDQIDLFVMPVALGDGIPLFAGGATHIKLQLMDNEVYADGVVRLTYRPA